LSHRFGLPQAEQSSFFSPLYLCTKQHPHGAADIRSAGIWGGHSRLLE
jgi:hypothetical protein